MHAVRPEVATAGQHDHPRRPRLRAAIGGAQPLALQRSTSRRCRSRSAAQPTRVLLVAESRKVGSVAGTGGERRLRHAVEPVGEHHRRRQLERRARRRRRRFRCVIHTAPSTVARQIAPWRRAITSPGGAAQQAPSGCASCSCTVDAEHVVGTPGTPSAARILRSTVAVSSRRQSIARSAWRIGGRQRPRAPGRCSERRRRGRRPAIRSIASSSCDHGRLGHLVAIEAAPCWRRAAEIRAVAQMSPASMSPLASSTVTPQSGSPSLDRPVERRRAAVADDAGMHDEAAHAAPDGLRESRAAGTARPPGPARSAHRLRGHACR